MDIRPDVQAFFDPATNTISYIVKDPTSDACAIVDSVMDIDYAAGRITHDHADELIRRFAGSVDGVIYHTVQFCDNYAYEYAWLKSWLDRPAVRGYSRQAPR